MKNNDLPGTWTLSGTPVALPMTDGALPGTNGALPGTEVVLQ